MGMFGQVSGYLRDLGLSVRKRGLVGTARLLVPEVLFDLRYGTDTLRIVSADEVARDVRRARECLTSYGGGYQGVNAWLFRAAIRIMQRELGFSPEGLTFIDYGSGKGRALLLAAQVGFKRAIGVEYSPALVTVSRANVARFRKKTATDCEIETVLADATEYQAPPEASFFFFFNPFGSPILDQVLSQLTSQLKSKTGAVWFLYMNPTQPRVFETAGLVPVRVMHISSAGHVDAILYQFPSGHA